MKRNEYAEPTEMAGVAEADTEMAYAWALDYDDPDEFPTQRLTPRRITSLGIGASLVTIAVAGAVALGVLRQPDPAPTPASAVETTTKPAPPAPPPVTATVTVLPPPPPVTVTVQPKPVPTVESKPVPTTTPSCTEGDTRIQQGGEGDPETCENGRWHEGPYGYLQGGGG